MEETPLQAASRSKRATKAIDFAGKTKFDFGLLTLLRNPFLGDIPTVTYLKAAGEGLFLALVISWIITFVFNPGVIQENPLKTRLGYNNLCVGWDTRPARELAMVLWILISYLALRFVYMNCVRFYLQSKQEGESGRDFVFKFAIFSNLAFGTAIAVFTLCLAIPPFDSVWLHTIPFIGFIITRYLVVLALCLEDWPEDETSTKIFLYVYGFISFILPTIYISEYSYYDTHGEKSPWPWQITFALDYGWFFCLAITSKFIPNNMMVHREFELIELDENDDEEAGM